MSQTDPPILPAPLYRIPDPENFPRQWVNRIHNLPALEGLRLLPDACVALAVTSPPYWDVIDYGVAGQTGHSSYDDYLSDLLEVWKETARVLIPNGKLAIVTPIMPIPKKIISEQHTRHLKNISSDIEHTILQHIPELQRYSLFVWQKQTTEKMFGSYPYPPNLYEDNTIEFINVFVKEGVPCPVPKAVKEASRLTQEEWRNLTMQLWSIYPADVKRSGGHPCPFPVELPLRLIRMYTFQRDEANNFIGDIVLDMFNGTGATCLAAKAAGRNYIGFDLNPEYCKASEERLKIEDVNPKQIFLQPVKVKRAVNRVEELKHET
ncbi:MAG: DNA-methyltransferase [bacterium]